MDYTLSGWQVKATEPCLRTSLPNSRNLNEPMAPLIFWERTRKITTIVLSLCQKHDHQGAEERGNQLCFYSGRHQEACGHWSFAAIPLHVQHYDPVHIGTCPVDYYSFSRYDPVYITTCPVNHPVFRGCER
jgi:hypothetical protein